jgi:hypothetical protein
MNPACGCEPSAQLVSEQKLCSVVSVPPVVILKAVPLLCAPLETVVP